MLCWITTLCKYYRLPSIAVVSLTLPCVSSLSWSVVARVARALVGLARGTVVAGSGVVSLVAFVESGRIITKNKFSYTFILTHREAGGLLGRPWEGRPGEGLAWSDLEAGVTNPRKKVTNWLHIFSSNFCTYVLCKDTAYQYKVLNKTLSPNHKNVIQFK